jgi:hypothetical protein
MSSDTWFFPSQVTLHTTCQILNCACQLTSIFLIFGKFVFVCQMSKTLSKIHTGVHGPPFGRRQLGLGLSPTPPTEEFSASPVEWQHEFTSSIRPSSHTIFIRRIPAPLHGLHSHSQHSLNVRGKDWDGFPPTSLFLCCVCVYVYPSGLTFEPVYILGQEEIHL